MKASFIHRTVNGPYEDPVVYVRLVRQRRALLFDLGAVYRLAPGDVRKITDIFVTHTHMDHFAGFDFILRALIGRDIPLRLYGPASLADNVEGKLRGYTWNLIRQYPLEISVFSLDGGFLRHTVFRSSNGLKREELSQRPFKGLIADESDFYVNAVELDHNITALGYALSEDRHINVDKAALDGMALQAGPWLKTLKDLVRNEAPAETPIEVNGSEYTLKELRDRLLIVSRGQKIAYIADSAPTEENIQKCVELARGADTLYIEAHFLDEDIEMARKKHHLTARIAGLIGRHAGVEQLRPMHFSPRYSHREAIDPRKEALEAFLHG